MNNYFTCSYRYRSWRFSGRAQNPQTLQRLTR